MFVFLVFISNQKLELKVSHLYKMETLCIILLSLIYCVFSACQWDDINLGALSRSTIQCTFNGNQYEMMFSPCRDDISCNIGSKFMAVQDDLEDNTCFAYLASWDEGVSPQKSDYNGMDMYTFAYDNGQADGGCPDGRFLDAEFVCDPDANPYDTQRTDCGEEAQNCHYYIRVYTRSACPGGGGGDDSSSSDGLSGGWVFIIIFISCLFAYCAFGTIYMGVREKDWTIPNAQFWVKVPSLVIAGCGVTYQRIMKMAGKDVGVEDDGYELNDPST